MARALAINVAANTNLPGVRGPIYPDGSFVYLPIPEREPLAADADVPTYADLVDSTENLQQQSDNMSAARQRAAIT